nr:MAG: ORF2 [Torque teno polar bear virus 12]
MSSLEKKLTDLDPCEHWLVSVAASHKLWCQCSDYRVHIPGWPTTGDGGDGDADATPADAASGAGDAPSDAELAAVCFDLGFADLDAGSG